jgi:hypothetical protein
MDDLIKELEAATGPDYRLDHRIHIAVDGNTVVPRYTSSIDAALALVPKNGCWLVSVDFARITFDGLVWKAAGISAPIALCIVALKARDALADLPTSA